VGNDQPNHSNTGVFSDNGVVMAGRNIHYFVLALFLSSD
jgi:hypothetical protein